MIFGLLGTACLQISQSAQPVGWVVRSETHHGQSHMRLRLWIAPMTGFAALNPSYEPRRSRRA
jgi:hypothetical protein